MLEPACSWHPHARINMASGAVERPSQADLLREWMEARLNCGALRMDTARTCCRQILGKRCIESSPSHDFRCEPHLPPGVDHVTAWRQGRKTVAIVSQPYQMSTETMQALIAFCRGHGFRCSVGMAPPWWYEPEDPRERMITVVITAKEFRPAEGDL